jgi:hypothetical protein
MATRATLQCWKHRSASLIEHSSFARDGQRRFSAQCDRARLRVLPRPATSTTHTLSVKYSATYAVVPASANARGPLPANLMRRRQVNQERKSLGYILGGQRDLGELRTRRHFVEFRM